MTKRALLLCSSTDGQTRRICERLCRMLEDAGATVTLTMIDDAEDVAPAGFDLAVVGARIRYGRTDARVIDFARRHAATLEAMPSAYFSVNIVARKAGKDRPETNPYVGAFLRRARWRPRRVDVFAGRLDYPRYRRPRPPRHPPDHAHDRRAHATRCGGRIHRLAAGRGLRTRAMRRSRLSPGICRWQFLVRLRGAAAPRA